MVKRELNVNHIIAIDFDGTISSGAWPDVGPAYPEAFSTIRSLQQAGYKLILWTCRHGVHLEGALSWLKAHGITFDAVNTNLPEIQEFYGETGIKITAGTYVDDRSFPHFNPDTVWQKLREKFLEREL